MALIIRQCPCGTEFEYITTHGGNYPTYCPECRVERKRQQSAEAKRRYLASEKGKQKARECSRTAYYKNREVRCAQNRAYYATHKEERKARMRQRYAENYEATCIRCKHTFERQDTERICPDCLKAKAEIKQKMREAKPRVKSTLKRPAESILGRKNAISTSKPMSALPTEEQKQAMLRAALAKFRAA